MRKIIFTMFLFALLPGFAGAHGDDVAGYPDFGMMRQIEDSALGDELHEEMEALMEKMVAGTMSEAEQQRMVELMREYPGPQAMMMNRVFAQQGFTGSGGYMMGVDAQRSGAGWGMMGNWGMAGPGGFWFWTLGFGALVWLVVGVLATVWLWRHIIKK